LHPTDIQEHLYLMNINKRNGSLNTENPGNKLRSIPINNQLKAENERMKLIKLTLRNIFKY